MQSGEGWAVELESHDRGPQERNTWQLILVAGLQGSVRDGNGSLRWSWESRRFRPVREESLRMSNNPKSCVMGGWTSEQLRKASPLDAYEVS
jgi:hypothetical protein